MVIAVAIGLGLLIAVGGLKVGAANGTTTTTLPSGCVKPVGGFLLVTTNLGWNNSILHGTLPYPILTVTEGQNVTIVVCNIDNQDHGVQIYHYYDSSIVSEAPGQVLTVNFVADKAGSFEIFCSIFCTIHPQMIGELNVTSA